MHDTTGDEVARFLLSALLILAVAARPAVAEIYTCDNGSIRVFADDAVLNDPPVRILQSAALTACYGIALDSLHDEVWAGTLDSVSAFRASANGTVSPLRSIGGSASAMGFVASVAVDVEANELFVGTAGGELFVFPRDATGNAAPLRKISGPLTELADVLYVFVDRVHDELFLANYNGAKVVVFDRTDTGNVAPSRSFPVGPNPFGIFVDPYAGELFIASGAAHIPTYDLTGNQLRVISGDATQIDKVLALTLTAGGQLLAGSQSTAGSDYDPILGFPRGLNGDASPSPWIFTGAPPMRDLWGLTSNRALSCGEGNVASHCLFRDGFERGDIDNWSTAAGGPP